MGPGAGQHRQAGGVAAAPGGRPAAAGERFAARAYRSALALRRPRPGPNGRRGGRLVACRRPGRHPFRGRAGAGGRPRPAIPGGQGTGPGGRLDRRSGERRRDHRVRSRHVRGAAGTGRRRGPAAGTRAAPEGVPARPPISHRTTTAAPVRARTRVAKRQRRPVCPGREPLARRRRPAARSRRNTASLTVLASTRPHDGCACPAGLRTGPAGLVRAPALDSTLRDGAGS